MSTRTGPGRPVAAMWNASAIVRGMLGRVGDQEVVLGDRHRDAADVRLLEGVRADRLGGDLAGDRDQRDRVHVRVGDRGDEVGGAGARGRHADADLAGGLGVAGGRVARALLVADQDVPDLRGVHHRVVRGEDRTAGNAEYRVGADLLERTDEGLRARDVLDGGGLLRPPVRARGCGWWAPVACSVIGILFSKLRVFARISVRRCAVQQKTPRAVRQARGARRCGRWVRSGTQLQPTRFPSTRIRVRMALTLPPARTECQVGGTGVSLFERNGGCTSESGPAGPPCRTGSPLPVSTAARLRPGASGTG